MNPNSINIDFGLVIDNAAAARIVACLMGTAAKPAETPDTAPANAARVNAPKGGRVMDPEYIDVDAMYEERTELPYEFDDTLALDPADESNYEDSDADPETGITYGDVT